MTTTPLTGDGDCDGDTLSFDQERQLGTDPANPDTDDDGIDDDMAPTPCRRTKPPRHHPPTVRPVGLGPVT